MKRSALHIYALAVCGLLIIPLFISGGVVIYSIFELTWPELMMPSHEYQRYQSDDAYREHLSRWSRFPGDESGPRSGELPADAEIAKRRQMAFQEALERERRDGVQSIIRSIIFGLISLMLFLLHWRIARRERRATEG